MTTTSSDFPEDDIAKRAGQSVPEHAMLPEMLKDSEAAALLGIGRTKFRQMANSNRTPRAVNFGRAIRWARNELLAWIDAGCPPRDKWEALKKQVKNPRSRF